MKTVGRVIASRLFTLERSAVKQHCVFAYSSVEAVQQIADLKGSGIANDSDDFLSFITIYEPAPE